MFGKNICYFKRSWKRTDVCMFQQEHQQKGAAATHLPRGKTTAGLLLLGLTKHRPGLAGANAAPTVPARQAGFGVTSSLKLTAAVLPPVQGLASLVPGIAVGCVVLPLSTFPDAISCPVSLLPIPILASTGLGFILPRTFPCLESSMVCDQAGGSQPPGLSRVGRLRIKPFPMGAKRGSGKILEEAVGQEGQCLLPMPKWVQSSWQGVVTSACCASD